MHVFNRLDVLKVELVEFYEEKALLATLEREGEATTTNPKTKMSSGKLPTEDELMSRLSRLNRATVAKSNETESKSKEVEKLASQSTSEPIKSETKTTDSTASNTSETDSETPLDFSIFDSKPKAAKKVEEAEEDPRLIPDVEIVDPRLDLSWLESDPLFGSKNRPVISSSSSSSATSSTNSTIPSQDGGILDRLGSNSSPSANHMPSKSSGVPQSSKSAPPPSYSSLRSYPVPSEPPKIEEISVPSPTAKYKVVTTIASDPAPVVPPVSSSPFSLPSSSSPSMDPSSQIDFSITRTIRGQQFDASAMNERLLNTTVDATCSTFIPLPNDSQQPQTPKSSAATPQIVLQAPQYQAKSPAQYVPVLAGGTPSYVAASSQQQRAAMLSLMGNVPVVFKPGHMNVFDPSRAVAIPSPSTSASSASSSKAVVPKPTGAPPAYGSVAASSQKKSSSGSSSPTNAKHQHGPTEKPPAYKKPPSVSTSAGAKYTGSSAFPLLTNQRPGAAVKDSSLRTIEMDGDMFDRFVQLTNRNTFKGIETCGILAGSFLPQKNIFRVTHLIIPKQTGTSDTCATTNEDEIFEYQIKHDLLTLGWIHTHPTQACFLSSVDLHTQSSYQTLFPEAVAVVIAPRDTPNFAFFHLSKSGFPIIQNCPLSGFHHHPERGLYEACSHVKLSWSSKKPCKVVDMR